MFRQLLIAFILLGSQAAAAQWDWGAVDNARLNLGNNEEFAGFELLDTPLSQSRLVILGQNSEYGAFNRKLEFKTLRYLQKTIGLRRHLMAVSPNQAYWINRFIVHGDTGAESLLGANAESRYFKMYKAIKKLNDKLPADNKISITGIDFETSAEMPSLRIAALLPDTLIPEKLMIGIETLKAVAAYCKTKKVLRFEPGLVSDNENTYEYNSFSSRKSMFSFLAIYDSLKTEYKNWLGNGFFALDSAVNSIREYKQFEQWQSTSLEDVWREDIFFHRTVEALNRFPKDKFLLITGRCHTPYQIVNGPCNLWHFSSLAKRLRETGDSNFKTLSVGIFYTGDNQIDSDLEDESSLLRKEIEQISNRYLYAKEAKILSPSLVKKYPVVASNFDMLILNNRYPLFATESEKEDGDDIETAERKKRPFYNYAKLYLGYQSGLPKLNWEETNRALSNAGMAGIENRLQNNYFITVKPYNPDNTKPWVRFSFGETRNNSAGYNNTRLQSSAAFNLVSPHSPLRLLMGYALAWQSHQITKKTTNTATTFISQYEKPIIIRNPMTLLGGYLAMQIEIRYFFISGEIGYLRDLSNQRWKLDGNYTSTPGKLAGHQSYWNLGAGICIPISTAGGKVGSMP